MLCEMCALNYVLCGSMLALMPSYDNYIGELSFFISNVRMLAVKELSLCDINHMINAFIHCSDHKQCYPT